MDEINLWKNSFGDSIAQKWIITFYEESTKKDIRGDDVFFCFFSDNIA